MDTNKAKPALTIRRFADVLAVIPEILGFQPQESLVALVLRSGVVEATARIGFPALRDRSEFWLAAESMARIWRPFAPAHGFLVAYTEQENPWPTLRELAGKTAADPLWLAHVGRGRWRADGPEGPSGSYFPSATGPLGRPYRDSRAELAKTILPLDTERELAKMAAKQKAKLSRLPAQCWGGRLSALLAEYDPGAGLPAPKCAQAAVLVCHSPARDIAIAAIQHSSAARMGEFWGEVVRRAPQSLLPHPLGLLALAAWVDGNGALQMICVERAESLLGLDFHRLVSGYHERDPEIPALIGMNAWLNFNVVHPSAWDQIRQDACAGPPGKLRAG
ncbi:MAG: DUF4192 domain-containing protein [Propionibacteriaceae bacterium]|jgi:hypothetical protein|nr:DUF4192 domain-containing protein [Propionibacteriaceae bacterium]